MYTSDTAHGTCCLIERKEKGVRIQFWARSLAAKVRVR